MDRTITGFMQDAQGDWIARLDCAHRVHMRHAPPFVERDWVTSAAGRAAHVGRTLDCIRCARQEWPDDVVSYKRTPEFSATTIPAGLLRDHSTKRGVWARIHVLDGTLEYRVPSLDLTTVLDPAHPGTVLPEVLHSVAPRGDVRFFVEFHRAPDGAPDGDPHRT
ncbi:MAG: DUF3565 domain-containing protein [Gammaproteobacteria bacterium]